MNPIGAGASPLPATVSPYAPPGKPPVGLEPPENKNSALPPVEESAPGEQARADQTSRKTPATDERPGQRGGQPGSAVDADLDAAEVAEIRELAAISRKVHAHEAAHAAAGGALAGAKSFTYVTGPDGVRYAVAGEVSIDFGQSDNPELTLRNASQVRSAALAPADPSGQDLRVATQAGQIMQQAQQDLARLRSMTQTAAGQRGRADAAIDAFGQIKDEASKTTPLLDQRA